MKLPSVIRHAERALHRNSPAILTGVGISGVVTTAYLAGTASYKAHQVIQEEAQLTYTHGADELTRKEAAKLVWKLYIPAVASGALSIACIVAGARIGAKRTAAAYSLLSVSERAFSEYKDKVIEEVGKKKEQSIRDDIAQDRVNASKEVVIVGSGKVLCYELHTGRYFESDMETLRKAQNDINAKLHREMYAYLSDFYHLVGLPHTSHSFEVGWTSDKQMELRFSTVLSEDNRPCIAFEFNYVKPL